MLIETGNQTGNQAWEGLLSIAEPEQEL